MAIFRGPFVVPNTAEEAVLAAFTAEGLESGDLVVEEFDPHVRAFRWRLRLGATPLPDRDVVQVDLASEGRIWTSTGQVGHPVLDHGLVVDTELGWIVTVPNLGECDDELLLLVHQLVLNFST